MPTCNMSWTASAGPNLAGYYIHQSATSGGPYNDPMSGMPINTGLATSASFAIAYDTHYYFVVRAYNPQGIESANSAEVHVFAPTPTIPAPPTGVTATVT